LRAGVQIQLDKELTLQLIEAGSMTIKMDRRTFLQGTSVAALSTMLPAVAEAVPPRAVAPVVSSVVTSPPSLPTAALNRGRSQVNPNFLGNSGDYPFLNCMKIAQNWGLSDNSGWPDPSTLDSDGYPISISNGGVYTVFDVPSQASRPGNYVITWSGNGTVSCGMNNTIVSGNKTSTSGSGRYVFSTIDSHFVIGISSIGNPHITNMQVFHVNDEAALSAGQVFSTKFKQRLVEANFGVVRFLNWQNGNSTNITTWSTRKPITYMTYAGYEFRPSIHAGLTTNIGAAYSATLSGFKLADKATATVKFNASYNGPCTLNVNGTGNINILSEYAESLTASSYPIGGTWQSLATLVYDATLNAWIKQGGDAAVGSIGLNNGCPPELMVRLCAEIGAHPYFVTPALAIDPATDFVPSLAAYCRDNGPSWMIPRFEGPNETWNFGGGFYSTHYANAKATMYGWGADYHNWYGKVMSVLGQAVSIVYGNNRDRYQVICGVQTGVGVSIGGTASHNDRLASTKYLSQQPQAGYTASAAKSWVTHICCAQYYQPSEYGTAQETSDAAAFVAASGNPNLQASLAAAYAATVNGGAGVFTLSGCAAIYANWKTWAIGFNVNKMCGYEGGYSPDYTGSQADLLRAASKQAPSLSGFTTMNYNNFVGLADANFVAEFPSCFQLSGVAPSNNAWSVLEDVYQTPNPPQWNAIIAFNQPNH
jgi:hypothetical protein